MTDRTFGPVTAPEPGTEWDRAWSHALAALERGVARAEALLVQDTPDGAPVVSPSSRPDWVAPVLSGPLPDRLRARAEAIAARQRRVAEDLSRAIAVARQELRVAEKIQAHALDRATPAFLDASF